MTEDKPDKPTVPTEPSGADRADVVAPASPRGSGLRRAAHFLGEVPAFGYALAFLALIPLYGVIYYVFVAADFYHATVEHEQFFVAQQAAVVSQLGETVQADLLAAYGGNVVPVSADEAMCIDRLRVFDPSLTPGGQLAFKLVAPLHPAGAVAGDRCAATGASEVVVLNASTDLGQGFDLIVAEADAPVIADSPWLTVRYLDAASHADARRLFPAPPSAATFRVGDDPVYHQYALPAALNAELQALIRASQGFPAGIPGEFARMVYLSAVTATTTGYGDIVPITTQARLLTASESIAGLILVGLFLNSLSQSLPARRRAHPEAARPESPPATSR